MPTLNLFHVTDTLTRLLEFNVRALLLRQGIVSAVTVTAMPPERAGAATDTLNLHLYHVMEDANYRNLEPPGQGGPPASRQPLALSLFYILTAHHEINEVYDAENQQNLFSLAIKTMHDHSLVDDNLAISPDGNPPQTVMHADLRGRENHFEISPRPLTPEEAISFWTAEQTSTTRLSAYYEVRTVFIEPEEPTGASGRVYDLGLFVSPISTPVVERVSALTAFTPPAESGMPPQVLDTSPARAVLEPGSSPEVNRVHVAGSALTGDGQPGASQIVLRTPAWRELTVPVRDTVIDTSLNPGWNVEISATAAQFDLQGNLQAMVGGVATALVVTPGIYAVSVRTTRRQQTEGGTLRETTSESNQVAFSVGAHITQVVAGGPGRLVVQVTNTFDMTAAGLDVQLSIDGEIYDGAAAFTNAPTDAGLFVRQAGQIEFHPLFNPATAGTHPLRLIINGAESQPFWFTTP
jgi:hypothetical protein